MSDLISKQGAIEAVGLNTWAGSRISQLPTVEAIPVEWLRENALDLLDFGQGVETLIKKWESQK